MYSSPAVITVSLPEKLNSEEIGNILEKEGYLLSTNSSYLIERNWIQICLMGEFSRQTISPLLGFLKKFN